MSSIAGLIRWSGNAGKDDVERMLRTTPWRGAVTTVTSADGHAAFGCAALPAQPCALFTSPDLVVAAAGYVHRADAHDDVSAAALIAAAYTRWGESCAERIDGEVSFAIWDVRERRLALVRDRMGTRPLAFVRTADGVAFGSDTQAVRAMPGFRGRLNDLRIAQYLADELEDARATFYEGVERLPAGTLATVTDAGARGRTYWEPARGIRPGATDADDVERFRTLFVDAVRARMPADAAIGILLSGGLDSSSVAGVAAAERAAAGEAPPVAVTGVFDSLPESDERAWVATMLMHTGTPGVQVRVDDASLLAHTSEILRCHDEPPWLPNLFMFWHGLLPASRAAGITVLLDGAEGDTVVSHGIARIHDLFWGMQWRTLWREARALEGGSSLAALRAVRDLGVRPAVPTVVRRIFRRFRRADRGVPNIVSQALAQRTGLAERQRIAERHRASGRNDAEAHWLSVTSGVNAYINEILERSAAWHGIELQHPFYDHRLIEHCVGVAADRKLRNGETRWILREAMIRYLPAKIRTRKDKADLSPNFRRAFAQDAENINAMLRTHAALLDPYVDHAALRAAGERYRASGRELDGLALWKAAMLGEWLAATQDTMTAKRMDQ